VCELLASLHYLPYQPETWMVEAALEALYIEGVVLA